MRLTPCPYRKRTRDNTASKLTPFDVLQHFWPMQNYFCRSGQWVRDLKFKSSIKAEFIMQKLSVETAVRLRLHDAWLQPRGRGIIHLSDSPADKTSPQSSCTQRWWCNENRDHPLVTSHTIIIYLSLFPSFGLLLFMTTWYQLNSWVATSSVNSVSSAPVRGPELWIRN